MSEAFLIFLAQSLQLHVLVVAAAQRDELVVSASLADRTVLDEVAEKRAPSAHRHFG